MPVDNFYIGTYLMFGLPFVAFMLMVIRATFAVTDVYKLSLIFVSNLFTITVLNYGPATGLLIIALGFSEVFSRRARDIDRHDQATFQGAAGPALSGRREASTISAANCRGRHGSSKQNGTRRCINGLHSSIRCAASP